MEQQKFLINKLLVIFIFNLKDLFHNSCPLEDSFEGLFEGSFEDSFEDSFVIYFDNYRIAEDFVAVFD
jgi:hypothetical protein